MENYNGQPSGRKRLSRAYIAGFIDADGWIGISKRRNENWYSITVSITQSKKYLSFLYELKEKYGGCVTIPNSDNKKFCPIWRIQSNEAYKLLVDIRPKLILKGEQALVAMRLQENLQKHKYKFQGKTSLPQSILSYREKLRQEICRLNQPFSPAETEFKDAERRSDSPNYENDKFVEQKPEEVC